MWRDLVTDRVPPTPGPFPRRGRGGAGCGVVHDSEALRLRNLGTGGPAPHTPRDTCANMKGQSHVPA